MCSGFHGVPVALGGVIYFTAVALLALFGGSREKDEDNPAGAYIFVLATIGLYGVVSYSVNQRMREFSLRVALGASPTALMRMIVTQGVRLSLTGTVIGLIGAAVLVRVLGSLLYEVSATDPLTFGIVALLALITTACACYLPARRATHADPMDSLRAD